jgi:hypothetical protein
VTPQERAQTVPGLRTAFLCAIFFGLIALVIAYAVGAENPWSSWDASYDTDDVSADASADMSPFVVSTEQELDAPGLSESGSTSGSAVEAFRMISSDLANKAECAQRNIIGALAASGLTLLTLIVIGPLLNRLLGSCADECEGCVVRWLFPSYFLVSLFSAAAGFQALQATQCWDSAMGELTNEDMCILTTHGDTTASILCSALHLHDTASAYIGYESEPLAFIGFAALSVLALVHDILCFVIACRVARIRRQQEQAMGGNAPLLYENLKGSVQ